MMENVLGFGGYCLGGKDNYECFEYYNFFYYYLYGVMEIDWLRKEIVLLI